MEDNQNSLTFQEPIEWPYPIRYGEETRVNVDVLVLGGGLSGCFAAINAARKGLKVAVVDKSPIVHSGAAGSGVDHWMDCPSNPASKVDPEEFTLEPVRKYKGGYANVIANYITARDSWDALCELEQMGMKIRDTDDVFKGAPFRDEATKLLFAYDYETRTCIRIWGTGMKPSLHKECKRLGVQLYERIMVTSLLTEGGRPGGRVVGATGIHTRTGEFFVFRAKASVLCMATPERLWIFSSEWTGLVGRDGPPANAGNGHAMAWRAGAEFARMESSSHEEWGGSTGIGAVLFGTGSNFATWYPCTIVDAEGKEVPWVDREGNPIHTLEERTKPGPGQKFLTLVLGGGEGKAESMPHLIPDLPERIRKGEFKLPLYADLPGMPEYERRVIFGLMVGQEGHTWPVYRNLTEAGFDPDKDQLQVYEIGAAPPGWRRLRYGGLVVDWDLRSNLEGLYAGGQSIFDGIGVAHASSTGRWAGRSAAAYAQEAPEPIIDEKQVNREKTRIYAPIQRADGINWKELQAGIAKVMQDYCGDTKTEELMALGLKTLEEIREGESRTLFARTPHELMRALEVLDILTCCEMIIHASRARKASNSWLHFERLDFPQDDPPEWRKWVTLRLEGEEVRVGELALDYHGDIKKNYETHKKE
ncbi:MAG: FAD-dependent oxidoreductase [Deltaproteobacteria bacterium]|nr:FAD-dependent oxidoreductase [Deltaproteobacteria bacterium]